MARDIRQPGDSKQQRANSKGTPAPLARGSKQQTANSKGPPSRPRAASAPSTKPGRQKRTSRIHRAPSGTRAQPATERLRAQLDAAEGAPTLDAAGSSLQPPASSAGETRRAPSIRDLPSSTVGATRPQKEPSEGFIAVGRVLGPFGLRGELKVQPLTDNPARFAAKSRLYAGEQLVTVASSREAAGHLYVKLKGFNDRTSAERFRHALLQVPEEALPPLADGEYYRFQLIGLEVVGRDGAPLGVLEEVIETGANDVYRVRRPEGADLLLPALTDVILHIDLPARRMVVDPPEWR